MKCLTSDDSHWNRLTTRGRFHCNWSRRNLNLTRPLVSKNDTLTFAIHVKDHELKEVTLTEPKAQVKETFMTFLIHNSKLG